MPDWFPSYTNCSSAAGWYNVPAWAIALIGGSGLVALIAASAPSAISTNVTVEIGRLIYFFLCNLHLAELSRDNGMEQLGWPMVG